MLKPTPQSQSTSQEASDPAPKPFSNADSFDHFEILEQELRFVREDRHWRVRGLTKCSSYEQLKVNLMVRRDGLMHVDTLDLYVARLRSTFIKRAATELYADEEKIKQDVGHLLAALESLQAQLIEEAQDPHQQPPYEMSEQEREAGLAYLKRPDLLAAVSADIESCGLIGETTGAMLVYLAAVSRKLPRPLAVVIQSSPAAGKTTLMDAVLEMIPDEEKLRCSAVTGRSLFYMGKDQLKRKVLAIAEDEGARNATYAMKLLQSDGKLSIVTTGRNGKSGRTFGRIDFGTRPAALLLTTTAAEIDDELLSRALLVTVSEEAAQTRAIHAGQRSAHTLEGRVAGDSRESIRRLHRNAQRLLDPVVVVNPFADQLTFPDHKTRYRRDHEHYLTLIDAICLLHQHQRKRVTRKSGEETAEYIEVAVEDITAANRLMHELLGQAPSELPPQTRKLLALIRNYAADRGNAENLLAHAVKFTRSDLRAETSWGDTQLKVHLSRLVDMEYVHVIRGTQFGRHYYQLVSQALPKIDQRRLAGLVNVEELGASRCRLRED